MNKEISFSIVLKDGDVTVDGTIDTSKDMIEVAATAAALALHNLKDMTIMTAGSHFIKVLGKAYKDLERMEKVKQSANRLN